MCDVCNIEWSLWLPRDDPPPECAVCLLRASPAVTSPAVLTAKSKAVDIAQETMEEMGYTNFKDNQRAGDIAVMAPSAPTAAETHTIMQRSAEMARELEVPPLSTAPPAPGAISQEQMGAGFWQGSPSAPIPPQVQQQFTGAAIMGAHQARAEGADPIALLHSKRPPFKLNIMADDRPRR